MDPITGAVVAIVIWLILIGLGAFIIFWLSAIIGSVIGGDSGGTVGAIIGWVISLGWSAFALIQVILQIVHLIQLIVGG